MACPMFIRALLAPYLLLSAVATDVQAEACSRHQEQDSSCSAATENGSDRRSSTDELSLIQAMLRVDAKKDQDLMDPTKPKAWIKLHPEGETTGTDKKALDGLADVSEARKTTTATETKKAPGLLESVTQTANKALEGKPANSMGKPGETRLEHDLEQENKVHRIAGYFDVTRFLAQTSAWVFGGLENSLVGASVYLGLTSAGVRFLTKDAAQVKNVFPTVDVDLR
eukprot:gnl/TRDRNA2_/TRDRNA2_89527_c0_seq2.p1 gnl/TRDRNA2_/TRDRNA2_89527_c0~~gnl/TRDRNA2_/TRDRNA2_89527_c0_seq2.p1  ORF type:complete len:226 (+),score=33.83 gnl/TRDRNA2_/TRDRNA2_89527_c0_seq2:58-735(+)